jgi:hypothetical protein
MITLLKSDMKQVGAPDLTAPLAPSLDFGKAPVTPIEHVIELVRLLAGDRLKSPEKSERQRQGCGTEAPRQNERAKPQ